MLVIEGLFAGYGRHRVLGGVDLRVERGELVAIVGPNGCGKTTLLRAISGLQRIEGGTITIDGEPVGTVKRDALARRIAVVAQDAALPERFSAFEVAMMGRTPHLRLLQSEGNRDLRIVQDAMARADCWDLRERPVDELSGGERQRVVIARALAQEPDLLLLDEPTSHLDIAHQAETFRLVLELCRASPPAPLSNEWRGGERGIAAVAVVHDLTLAATFADRIAVMLGGRIIADGAPGDVMRAELIERVYGLRVRVMTHPATGRPVVVPDALAAPTQDSTANSATTG